mmetsp:Transcript_16072/g.51435  ORF Transcript_16072/g.51435 Transcript_16072/m.51435 type:complete len:264 (-) Transcript_16072:298-1089(-)
MIGRSDTADMSIPRAEGQKGNPGRRRALPLVIQAPALGLPVVHPEGAGEGVPTRDRRECRRGGRHLAVAKVMAKAMYSTSPFLNCATVIIASVHSDEGASGRSTDVVRLAPAFQLPRGFALQNRARVSPTHSQDARKATSINRRIVKTWGVHAAVALQGLTVKQEEPSATVIHPDRRVVDAPKAWRRTTGALVADQLRAPAVEGVVDQNQSCAIVPSSTTQRCAICHSILIEPYPNINAVLRCSRRTDLHKQRRGQVGCSQRE